MRKILLAAVLLSGCATFDGSERDVYRFKLADGTTAQCREAETTFCGVVPRRCNNSHAYYCVHALDVEMVPPDAPLPPPTPPQPAPAK